jgi:hypothetical protein
MPLDKAFDEALDVIQRGAQSSAASAVNKLAVRLAAIAVQVGLAA